MLWKTFNDQLALYLLVAIPAIWLLSSRVGLEISDQVEGALILAWGLVLQFYFRKKESE